MAKMKIEGFYCRCKGCGKVPEEIMEYQMLAEENGYSSAEEAVRNEEGTFNPATGLFWCTSCYIKVGMPLGKAWEVGTVLRKIIRRITCKHQWKRLWMESAWWSGKSGTNPLETWYCECELCGRRKFVVFESEV